MSSQGAGFIFARQRKPGSLVEVTSKPDLRRDLVREPILADQVVDCRIGIRPNFVIEVTNGVFVAEPVPIFFYPRRFFHNALQTPDAYEACRLPQVRER